MKSLMKSQYQDAKKFIKDKMANHVYIEQDLPVDDTLHALLNALEVIAVEVKCGWHGDDYKEKKTFIMTNEEFLDLKIEET